MEAIWVPSHTTIEDIEAGVVTKQHHEGSAVADKLAEIFAEGCQVPDHVVEQVQAQDAIAWLIRARLIAIHKLYSGNQEKVTYHPVGPKAKPNLQELLEETTHCMTKRSRIWQCERCMRGCGANRLYHWLRANAVCSRDAGGATGEDSMQQHATAATAAAAAAAVQQAGSRQQHAAACSNLQQHAAAAAATAATAAGQQAGGRQQHAVVCSNMQQRASAAIAAAATAAVQQAAVQQAGSGSRQQHAACSTKVEAAQAEEERETEAETPDQEDPFGHLHSGLDADLGEPSQRERIMLQHGGKRTAFKAKPSVHVCKRISRYFPMYHIGLQPDLEIKVGEQLIHPTHALGFRQGILFCWQCAAWSAQYAKNWGAL